MQTDSIHLHKNSYGCLFVKTGQERTVAEMMGTCFPSIEAHAVVQLKHQSRNGVRRYASGIMLPGYVLFHAQSDMPVSQILTITSAYRILKYCDDDWHLRDNDLSFAEWIFQNQGEIGVSVAYMEGDQVQIKKGPLKTVQGQIIRIDKRNRNALVSLGMNKQVFKVWLAFEWMDKLK